MWGAVGSEACSEPYTSCFAVVVEALGDDLRTWTPWSKMRASTLAFRRARVTVVVVAVVSLSLWCPTIPERGLGFVGRHVIVPSPSSSNREKASLNSAICSSVSWSAMLDVGGAGVVRLESAECEGVAAQAGRILSCNSSALLFSTQNRSRNARWFGLSGSFRLVPMIS